MRFDLLRDRTGKSHPRFVRARTAGSAAGSRRTTRRSGSSAGDVWILSHPVVNLAAPATYRFRVSSAGSGRGGQTLGTAVQSSRRATSPSCAPTCSCARSSVTPITSGPSAGQSAYIAVIANRGLTGAGPFAGRVRRRRTAPRCPRRSRGWGRSRAAREQFVAPALLSREPADRDRRPDADDRRVRLRQQRADDGLPGAGGDADRLTKSPVAPIYDAGPRC